MELSLREVREILEFIGTLDCAAVDVTIGDVHLSVRKRGATAGPAPVGSGPAATPARPADVPGLSAPAGDAPPPPLVKPSASVAADPIQAWLDLAAKGEVVLVRSPMVATFYRAKEPRTPPFVEVGSVVKEGDPLCLLEVMKLFQTIGAEVGGTIEAILVEDGALVEYEQPLMVIRR